MLLAEGFGQDAKGAITAIGINQSVLVAQSLPATTKRAVLVHLVDEEGSFRPGGKLHFSFAVHSPSGRVLLAQSGQLAVGEKKWQDLPASVDLPAEFALTAFEYGTHLIVVQIQYDGTDGLECSVPLYVHEPTDVTATRSATDGHESVDDATIDQSSDDVEAGR
jgi:hypothetical protein